MSQGTTVQTIHCCAFQNRARAMIVREAFLKRTKAFEIILCTHDSRSEGASLFCAKKKCDFFRTVVFSNREFHFVNSIKTNRK
eukprot:UN24018